MTAAQRWMLGALALAVVLANIAQPYPDVAPLHHAPTVALLLASPWLLGRWRLSDASVRCIVLFFMLHTLGGRYTYSNVPYDAWAQALAGFSISELTGVSRNQYDRLVHFAFGLLFVRPVFEFMVRHRATATGVAKAFALCAVFAAGGLYEVVEWGLTLTAPPALADDYNGQQGDQWDAQKDMALAGFGSIIALVWMGSRARG